MKLHHHEVAYPFLDQVDPRCDWELCTDRLASELALVSALLPPHSHGLREDIVRLQYLAYHLNGSIRGACGVDEADLLWLHGYLESLLTLNARPKSEPFVLPGGIAAASQCHIARCTAKSAVRIAYQCRRAGFDVPDLVFRVTGIMANVLSLLALEINRQSDCPELPFSSKSYGVHSNAQ